jgi:hypothetical protein
MAEAKKDTAAKGGEAQASVVDEKNAVVAKQMQTNSVDVVETNQAAPAEGWNKDIEINNLVDPNSTNLPHPRSFANGRPAKPHLNVVGVDVPNKNTEAEGPAGNGNVLDAGLVEQGTKAKK